MGKKIHILPYMTDLEQQMFLILRTIKGTTWISEHKFAHPAKAWRFDFAEPQLKIAIECEGGIWLGKTEKCPDCKCYRSKHKPGRHTSGTGFKKDCEKYNFAVLLGWALLRYTTGHITKEPLTLRNQVIQLVELRRDGIGIQYRLDEAFA